MDGNGLIYGFIFDGIGGGKEIGLNDVKNWKTEQGTLWLHFDYTSQESIDWIKHESGLNEIASEALLSEESRPRTIIVDGAALISLRGINLNPDSEPEDMVSVRLWVDRNKIISTLRRTLLSISDIAESLKNKKGPKTSGDFVAALTDRLITRMQETIESIEDRLAQAEEDIIMNGSPDLDLRNLLLSIRREAILLRRYLVPQREAMIKLHSGDLTWMNQTDNIEVGEVNDTLIRYLEDLDSVRDRAMVTQEELKNRLSEQISNRMYVLSLVAAIFLPLGFLTGLFGINVGGIPGANNNWAFISFIGILAVVVTIQLFIFKKNKWM